MFAKLPNISSFSGEVVTLRSKKFVSVEKQKSVCVCVCEWQPSGVYLNTWAKSLPPTPPVPQWWPKASATTTGGG